MSEELLDKILHFTRGKMRVFLSWLAIYFLISNIHVFPQWYGIFIMFLGASLRFISSGFIDKEGRLSVAGPYGYVRNPLYLGSILIAVGAALAQNSLYLTIFFTFFSVFIHFPIILAEEKVLKKKFGDPYLDFMQLVPRLFPWKLSSSSKKLLRHSNINAPHFSWKKCVQNKAYEAYLVFLGILILEVFVFYSKQIHIEFWTKLCSFGFFCR